jgi:outer membrane protein assembly factor BamA
MVTNNAAFTYTWKESQTKNWAFSPAFINVVHLPSKSPSFQERLDTNQFLANSYKETFIEGENLSFTFSNQVKNGGRNFSYLRLSGEEAGALLTAVGGADSGRSQYVKFDFDGQHQFTFKHSRIATRFAGGVGIPYELSPTLPYIKQYYVGGPYSLRGWRVRTLGPGSSIDSSGSIYIDRTGDIKLEANGEFRFDIAKLFAGFVKFDGAAFVDAGNIWLANKSASYPGGEFDISTLGHQIAADVGMGARFEIATFIVLRIDAAFPVKKPYVPNNNGWVIDQVDFGNPSWRANNLIVNIALGYPF